MHAAFGFLGDGISHSQAVREIATTHANALPLFARELEVVTEMCELLPLKLEALRHRAASAKK